MQKIYVVEYRSHDDFGNIESLTMFLASSVEKGIEYMKKNQDSFEDDRTWWWAMLPMPVDVDPDDVSGFDELYLYNHKVERIYWQPGKSGKTIELHQNYQYDFDFGEYKYFDDYMFEGILINTDNELLTFKDVSCYKNGKLVKQAPIQVYNLSDLHGIYPRD